MSRIHGFIAREFCTYQVFWQPRKQNALFFTGIRLRGAYIPRDGGNIYYSLFNREICCSLHHFIVIRCREDCLDGIISCICRNIFRIGTVISAFHFINNFRSTGIRLTLGYRCFCGLSVNPVLNFNSSYTFCLINGQSSRCRDFRIIVVIFCLSCRDFRLACTHNSNLASFINHSHILIATAPRNRTRTIATRNIKLQGATFRIGNTPRWDANNSKVICLCNRQDLIISILLASIVALEADSCLLISSFCCWCLDYIVDSFRKDFASILNTDNRIAWISCISNIA